jgi:hypothetical protein
LPLCSSSVSRQAPEVFADYLDDIVKYRLEEVEMASDVLRDGRIRLHGSNEPHGCARVRALRELIAIADAWSARDD